MKPIRDEPWTWLDLWNAIFVVVVLLAIAVARGVVR
jgi:hypothetical protein